MVMGKCLFWYLKFSFARALTGKVGINPMQLNDRGSVERENAMPLAGSGSVGKSAGNG
jgi:fructose-bisphosphate aldolase class 1